MSDTQSSVTRVVTVSSSSMYVSLKLAGLSVGSRSQNVAAFACRSAYLTSPPGRLAAHFVHFHRQFVAWSVILARMLMTGGLTAASCPNTATGPATARGPSEACAAPTTCAAAAASAAVSASAAVPASVAGASSVDAAPATGAAASAVAAAAAASTTTGAVPATCTCAGATGATGAAAAAASLLRRCFSRLRLWLCLG